MQTAAEWTASPPANREQDALMKRVLGLHVELVKLESQVQGRVPSRPHMSADELMASYDATG
jgi:hypothetical protein